MEEIQTNSPASDLLIFQVNRKTTDITKVFFYILEDLIEDGYIIPEDKFKRIRKKILDAKGNADRELKTIIEKLDISLKNNNM